MNRLLPALIGLALSPGAWPESLAPPVVNVGDTWIYRSTTARGPSGWNQTDEEIKVTRVTPTAIFIATKAAGSTQPPKELLVGPDWSRMRDLNGKETVVNRPLAFPLSDGKSWDVVYPEQNPNKSHKSEKFESHFRVVGYETVAQVAPGQSVVQEGHTGQGGATMVTQVQNTGERRSWMLTIGGRRPT